MSSHAHEFLSDPRRFLKAVRSDPESFFIIHYSCQSLYDDNHQLSPRITSIVIANYGTGQEVSFSTHAVAEELGISRTEVATRLDEIERALLESFNDFARMRRDKYWVHWNMRNLTYGFEHIAHRYRALGGQHPVNIPVERRLNLNDLLSRYFGAGYTSHPKLTSLMELNGGLHRHHLSGAEEVQAFENLEFIRMHNSTQSKVGFFVSTIRRWSSGHLRTQSRGWGVMLDKIFESRFAKAVGLLGAAISLAMAIAGVAAIGGL